MAAAADRILAGEVLANFGQDAAKQFLAPPFRRLVAEGIVRCPAEASNPVTRVGLHQHCAPGIAELPRTPTTIDAEADEFTARSFALLLRPESLSSAPAAAFLVPHALNIFDEPATKDETFSVHPSLVR